MPAECLTALGVQPGGHYLDATGGAGGHAALILDASGPDGSLVLMDRDPAALALCRARLLAYGDRVRCVAGNFDRVQERAGLGPNSVDGAFADLGVSSLQLDTAERGFSILRPGPLDMRMTPGEGPTAADLLRGADEADIEGWLRLAGEDRFARRLARRLKEAAPSLKTTEDLARAVARWVPRRGRTHPATRVFLALRMAVNREMESLDLFLERVTGLVRPGGRLAILTFHSTEDRRVKYFGRREAAAGRWRWVNKKPLRPTERERRENPRARSALLRAFEKCPFDITTDTSREEDSSSSRTICY